MQPSEFSKEKPGRLLRTPQGYWAYVPGALPPTLKLTWELASAVSEADRALAELAGTSRTLPNPRLFIAPFIRREAVLSSRIEGTQASLSDLFFFEASGAREERSPDVGDVAKYVSALEYGLGRLKDLPVSLALIREMHERLMRGARGGHLTPGEFRRSQNWIGPSGCTLMDATFVPPPAAEMHEALVEFEKFLHARSRLPALVRIGLAHYQFEAIHPFLDGNGRIGRLLITLLLASEKLLPHPLLYLSAYFERNRAEYYRRLLGVSRRGHWQEWMDFFLTGVAGESRDAIDRAGRLLDLWRKYRQEFQAARSSALLLRLLEDLFSYPAVTVPGAAKRLGVTQRSAQLNIDKLVRAGVLREATGRRRNRIFVADAVIRIIERAS